MFEGYTYGELWTEATEVISIGAVTPVVPANTALRTDASVALLPLRTPGSLALAP